MKGIEKLIVSICLILGVAICAYSQGWRRIVPLHSTREDVERLLGRPTESNGITYDLKTERVSIFYSGEPCVKGWPFGFDVTPNLVTKIVVYPKTTLTVHQLGLDVNLLTKTPNARLGGSDYVSKELGISVGVKDNEQVEVIQYEPSVKEQKRLCPEAADRQREIDKGESAYMAPILYYSNLPPDEEINRLKSFAAHFKKYSADTTIFVIGYAEPEECLEQGILRATRVKNRLVTELATHRRRVNVVNGGYKTSVSIELYVIGPGSPRPLSTPDVSPAHAKKVNCPSTTRSKR